MEQETNFSCKLCNQKFVRKSHFHQHLKTKKHICNEIKEKGFNNTTDDFIGLHQKVDKLIISYESKDILYKEMTHKYNECLSAFKALKNENKELKDEIKRLRNDFTNLKLKNTCNSTNIENLTQNTNTINNNNVNIHLGVGVGVCPFGRENWDYLSKDEVLPIMKRVNDCVPEMIKRLHYDERHPENHNLFIPNKRINQVKVFNGVTWETKEKNVTIEELKNKILDRLEMNYEEYFKKEASQFLQNLWEKLKDGDSDKYDQKELRNSIEYAILDNHTFVKKNAIKS